MEENKSNFTISNTKFISTIIIQISIFLLLYILVINYIEYPKLFSEKDKIDVKYIINKWHIFFVWEGIDIPLFAIKNIASFAFYNPMAAIRLYSTTLPKNNPNLTILNHWLNFKFVLLNLTELTQNLRVSHLAKTIAQRLHDNQPLAKVHFSDLLRVIILYLYGGTYFDADICCLKPLDQNFWLTNAHLFVDFNNSYVCGPRIYVNRSTYFACLCNCAMSFHRSHDFLSKLMDRFSVSYNPGSYVALGAHNFINIFSNNYNISGFTISDNLCSTARVNVSNADDNMLAQIRKKCPVFHLFNAGHSDFARQENNIFLKLQKLPEYAGQSNYF